MVRYVDDVIFLVNKPMTMVRYFNDAIFVDTDASFHGHGQCDILRPAHSGRSQRLIQDLTNMNEMNLSSIEGMVSEDDVPRLVSSATSSTSSTCEVYDEF